MFELILYQHHLELESAWEPSFISAVVHSNERAAWFKEELMGKNYSWSVAKQKVQEHFGGGRAQGHYLEKLTNMNASKHEDPVKYVEKFYNIFKSAGVADSIAYATILLKSINSHQEVVRQIKSTYASSPIVGRPEMTVGYIYRTLPLLYVEPSEDRKRKKEGRYETDKRPQDEKRYKGEHQERNKDDSDHAVRKRTGASRSTGPVICRYCEKKWYDHPKS
jgi:hypothetical protein